MLSRIKLTAAFIFIISFNASAQWVKTAGPAGMNVNCFYGVGNNLFAGTSSKGVFRSQNNGATWQTSNTGIQNKSVFSLTAKDAFVFAGTDDGVYRSADNGASWLPFNTNMIGKFVQTLYVANGFIYAGTTGAGLFKSSDNGSTWTDASGGALGSSTIHAVIATTSHLVVVADNLIFYSDDNGDSWFYEPTSPFLLVGSSSFLGRGDSVLLVSGRGIYRSFDGGMHWGSFIPVIPAGRQANINGLGSAGNRIVAGSTVGIYYSNNFGASWNGIAATGLRSGNWFTHQFYIYKNTLLLGYDEIGIALSTDRGSNWSYTLTGFTPAASIDNALTVSGNTLFSGTHGDGLYASVNGGNSWNKIGTSNNADTLSNSNIFATLALGNNILLAGTCGNGLYRSTNNGVSWTRIRNGLPQQTSGFLCVNSLARTATNILIGTDRGLYYSSDLGLNWNATNISGTNFRILGIAANGGVACAASASLILNNRIYRSANNGVSWSVVFETIADFTCMASDGANHFYAGTLNTTNVLSNDNGVTWQNFGPGIPADNGGYTIAVFRNNVFVGNNGGVYYSNNNGASFTQQNAGLDPVPNNSAQGLTFSATDVYAGFFQNSVWRRPLSDFGISLKATEITNDLHIKVIPNPVVATSLIKYHINKKGTVIINLYRSDGSLVKNILNAVQLAGDNTVQLQKNNLKPGNYYIAVITKGGYTTTVVKIE